MKQAFSYLLVLLCVGVSYQAWANSRLQPETETMSRTEVCLGGCTVLRESPNFQRADPLRRRYEWRTSEGQKTATCEREFILVGEWECVAELGTMGRF